MCAQILNSDLHALAYGVPQCADTDESENGAFSLGYSSCEEKRKECEPMPFKTGSIREVHRRLMEHGHHVSEHTIRKWVKQGIIPAAYCGRKAYINYDLVVAVLTNGTPQQPEDVKAPAHGIRRVG